MPIVSLSLNEKILEEIDRLEKTMGFSGRSEIMRAAIRHFIIEKEGVSALKGRTHAIIIATHSEDASDAMANITHKFDDIIITRLHNKAEKDRCLETFIVDGDAEKVKGLFKALQSSRKTDYVKLLAV